MVRIKVFPKSKQNSTSASNGGGYYTSSGSGLKSTKGVYLWGQYHDHTADIDGDITSKGNVTANGVNAITVSASSASVESLSASSANAVSFSASSASVETFSGKDATIESITAETISSSTINNSGLINTNKIKAVSGYIQTLLGENWTVDNLTVTKAAHFFKLIIDEIKASQGAIIITPANCVLDHVEKLSNGDYRCYFLNKDDEKEIYNNFEVNDQVICQTFNAATGTSYNVSNTYYWRLCTQTGTTGDYHYIDLSDTDKDRYSNSAPSAGDNCVLLGNRSDSSRQAAIIISAYNSGYLDKGIVAPSICQYEGINDYDLTTHRMNVLSKGLNSFKGTFITSTGDNIEDLLDKELSGVTTYLHVAYAMSEDGSSGFSKTYFNGALYIGMCSNLNKDDSSLVYSDYTWARIKGEDGESVNVDKWDVSYATSTSSTQPDDSAFVYPMPELEEGVFLWTLTRITYSDGTVIKSYSVSRIGSDGKEGTPGAQGPSGLTSYIHLAYANSADGSQGFSVTYFDDAKYIGTYTDYTKEDSTNYRDYEWKVLRGNDGKDITIVSTEILYAQTSTQNQPSEGSFSTSMPTPIAGYYMWTLTRITYSDGTVTRAYSCSKNGTNGENGEAGNDGEIYKMLPVKELAVVDKNSTLGVQFVYNIVHIQGDSVNIVSSYPNNYFIKFNDDTNYNQSNFPHSLSTYTDTPTYTDASYKTNYHTSDTKPKYFTVVLIGPVGNILDRRTVPVTFDAGATLEVKDDITAMVTSNVSDLNGKISSNTTKIASISATSETIQTKVEANTTAINTVSGNVQSTKSEVSQLKQTASGLTSSVENVKKDLSNVSGNVKSIDSRVSKVEQTSSGLTSTVERHTSQISDISGSVSTVSGSVSTIKQTADEISLSVNDLSVRLDNTKFEINADTVVNGSLTLTDSTQGFILKGDSGTTVISPSSVGEYGNRVDKTTIRIEVNGNTRMSTVLAAGNAQYSAAASISVELGHVDANKYISVVQPCIYVTNSNGREVSHTSLTDFRVSLYRNGSTSAVSTFTATSICHVSQVLNYYVRTSDNYRLIIQYQAWFKKSDLPNGIANAYYSCFVDVPTDSYSLIGYDGISMGYGGGGYLFSNYEGTWMKYGPYGLAVKNNGIFLYDNNKGAWVLWNGSSGSGGTANVGCKYISVNGTTYSVGADGYIHLPSYPDKVITAVTLNNETYSANNTATKIQLPNLATRAIINGANIFATTDGTLSLGSLVRGVTVNGTNYSVTASNSGVLTLPTCITGITNGSKTVYPTTGGSINISSLLSGGSGGVSGNYLNLDTTSTQTVNGGVRIKGDFRLQGDANSGNYGNKLKFGDYDNAYIGEESDDSLTMYAYEDINILPENGCYISASMAKMTGGGYATVSSATVTYIGCGGGTKGVQISNSGKCSVYTDKWNTMYVRPTDSDMSKKSAIPYSAYIRGNGYITGAWSSGSDERFKDKIEDKAYSVDDFANAPLFSFTWAEEPAPLLDEYGEDDVKPYIQGKDETEHVGTTAQYWKEKIPELVTGSEEDRYGLDYSTLGTVGAITNAREIVSLKQTVHELTQKNTELTQKNSELEMRLVALEDIVNKLSANS